MTETASLALFEGFGIEIEYMIVAADSLDVAPVCDWLMEQAAGEVTDEFENGSIAWNNELAMHVVEFKTNGPAPTLTGLGDAFHDNVCQANALLRPRGLMLLPTAAHPWMDPHREVKLWPHGQREIYEAFNRIFGCSGHGWGNLQSMHVNLPFQGDAQFGTLHAAIRPVLALIPGLAASSPVLDATKHAWLDARMDVYKNNCARIPSVTGALIPEPVYTIADYRDRILAQIYRDLAPHDPAGVLHHEWANARGAIARFDRMAIEIRVIDSQETPHADLAFAELIAGTVRLLTEQTWAGLDTVGTWRSKDLAGLLRTAAEYGERAEIHSGELLRAFGLSRARASMRQLWGHLAEAVADRGWLSPAAERPIEHYLRHGTLARRIVDSLPPVPDRSSLTGVYRQLASCLAEGALFVPSR